MSLYPEFFPGPFDKGIYGNASSKEIKELNEEGIETTVIPWIKENEN